MRLNVAIIFVSDMQRSIAFYRDVIGLPLRFESPSWTEFATDGATLALHHSVHPIIPNDHPEHLHPGNCHPGLGVPDLEDFHERMVAHGVTCIQPPTAQFGVKLAQYLDPDGLSISVGEDRES